MRTILCISFYGASWGGSFIPSLLALENEAKSQGYKIFFVFPIMGRKLPWAKFFPNAMWLPDNFFLKRRVDLKSVLLLRQHILRYQVTDVVTNFIGYNPNLRILRAICRGGYSQVIRNTFHSPSKTYWKKQLKLMLLNGTYDQFIGVSQWVAASMINNGLPADKVTSVRNAVDFNRLKHYESVNFRRDAGEILIFMMGWPYYVKGMDIAIRAIKHLRDDGWNVILITPHRNTMSDLLSDMGRVPDFVRFVEAREDVATFYNNIDIFLAASREEGFGFALIEAVSSDCLVICSDIPVMKCLNLPNIPMFKSGNWQDLYERLIYILNNRMECLSKKAEQRAFVYENFSMENWAKKMLTVILNNKKV